MESLFEMSNNEKGKSSLQSLFQVVLCFVDLSLFLSEVLGTFVVNHLNPHTPNSFLAFSLNRSIWVVYAFFFITENDCEEAFSSDIVKVKPCIVPSLSIMF